MKRWLSSLGFPMDALEAAGSKRLGELEEKLTPDQLLSATVALEHYTADTTTRREAMIRASLAFTHMLLSSMARQLTALRHVPRPRDIARVAPLLFGRRGLVPSVGRADDAALVADWRERLPAVAAPTVKISGQVEPGPEAAG